MDSEESMKWNSRVGIAVVVAAFVAFGCAPPEVPDDDEPVEEPTAEQEDEPVDEEDEPVEEDDEPIDEDEDPVEEDDEMVDEEDDEGVVGMVAVAGVVDSDEEPMGEVRFTQTQQGVLVEGELEHGELAGAHGFHVHEEGVCDAPDFETAGGHFNPTGHDHGGPHDELGQRHAGDFGNIDFDAYGVADFEFVDEMITLGSGVNDVVGQALIVHYEEDDLETQPTGDAGPRAGCGIIEVDDDPREEDEDDEDAEDDE